MAGLWVLMLYTVCMIEAIMVNNNNGSGDFNKTEKSDQLAQETQVKRSAGYGGYYPDDHHHGYGYDHDHGVDYYPHHHDHHHPDPHHHYHYDTFKALLVPLAGVALLGAAAIFASNPVLLQLGVIQGKRRRRDIGEKQLEDLLVLEKFMSHLPTAEVERQNRVMLASYLSCSGGCVPRVACEVHRYGGPDDVRVVDMVISEILENEYIDGQLKKSITKARKIGRSKGSCKGYSCLELDKIRSDVDKTSKVDVGYIKEQES